MFLKLDSDRYPMRTFGDLGYRIYGTWTRHGMNILQSIQLFFNVGVIIIGNGQGLSQMAKFKLCFSICTLVWALGGMIMGQIRTLQRFGHLANFAIWLNILVIFLTMGEAAHSPPNYTAATAVPGVVMGPIVHTVWVPPGSSWINQLDAAMQIVYSYGMSIFLYYSESYYNSTNNKLSRWCNVVLRIHGFVHFPYWFY